MTTLCDLYMNVARFFANSPDTTTWPANWQQAHANDVEHAAYWQSKAEALMEEVDDENASLSL